jgi:glycosyltransferase involved in cell wall biosynthesis
MRVAVVHDWLSESGGAEKVTRELVRLYDADVFALVDFLKEEDRTTILQGRHATTSFIQRMPFARSAFRSYLPLFPAAIQSLDLDRYDLIISSSYAFAKGVRKRPGQRHVCYIHTPMRWAWVNEEGYLRDHHVRSWKAWILKRLLRRLRRWDLTTNQHVDLFIANSRNVAGRVNNIYHRDAEVVLPPLDVDAFTLKSGARAGYLAVSRLVPYKRTDRIIEAFRGQEALRLTIVGNGPEAERLRALAPANVTFAGEVPQSRLIDLMQSAKALVCAANEDLGLTVLEAQACGTPVIALRAGGYLETVDALNGGAFFESDDPASIREAVLRHEQGALSWSPERLREGMMRFSTECFREQIAALVQVVIRHA